MLSTKLQDIRDRRAAGEKGFTLIELLVVVVIIGILVAIAIPLYLNYRNGAKNKSVQSDVRNGIPTIEQYYSDNGSYPATAVASAADGADITFTVGTGASAVNTIVKASDGNQLSYKPVAGNPASFCLSGTNSDTGKSWKITNTAGSATSGKIQTGTC